MRAGSCVLAPLLCYLLTFLCSLLLLLSLVSLQTAQGIRDAIAEDLPILLFANWRGFSGGAKDMFEEVLKFGAYIVDSLRDCRQPVIVYLPPHSTLRGGAWVVVDQTINEQYMEVRSEINEVNERRGFA